MKKEVKEKILGIRCTETEKAELEHAAEIRGLNVTSYVKMLIKQDIFKNNRQYEDVKK
ncbi:MAG: hypothetical protein RR620_12590 [Clostridium sp.]|uniref:plasmid mobilization protein n=1 Tax=Anaerorhabdus sp. TaxID=1872524 RepID=UPI002FC8E03C